MTSWDFSASASCDLDRDNHHECGEQNHVNIPRIPQFFSGIRRPMATSLCCTHAKFVLSKLVCGHRLLPNVFLRSNSSVQLAYAQQTNVQSFALVECNNSMLIKHLTCVVPNCDDCVERSSGSQPPESAALRVYINRSWTTLFPRPLFPQPPPPPFSFTFSENAHSEGIRDPSWFHKRRRFLLSFLFARALVNSAPPRPLVLQPLAFGLSMPQNQMRPLDAD